MFKNCNLVIFLSLLLSLPFSLSSEQPDEYITYEWLQNNSEQTSKSEYLPHFRRLFNTMQVRGLLECGCSFSTKYFLDNCPKVLSIEFFAPSIKNEFFKKCIKLYAKRTHWMPLLYNADKKDKLFNQACAYQNSTHKDPALINSQYVEKMGLYFKNYLSEAQQQGTPIDVAFVDSKVPLRGDMVNILLTLNVPIVIAHDTKCDGISSKDLWGWFKVVTPSTYEKISLNFGQGTTFWIKKDLSFVVSSIKTYQDSINALNKEGKASWTTATEIADELARF